VLVIGFGHRARQGKNTAAQAVLDACPLDMQVRMYAFADALKTEVRKVCCAFGGQYALIAAWKEAGLMPEWVQCEDPKPRTLLQWWGTEYRKAKDPDYWIKRLRTTLSEHNPDVALITDVRFPNEVAFIHGIGGYVCKVTRLGAPDVQVQEHPSEAVLDGYTGWDFSIQADTVAECQKKAREIYASVLRG
jgi:hypothetical protein